MAASKAFLIDGTAFCYRAFYAIRGLSTADGRPTNAVYGFARMLQALQDKHHPEYLAVAFDVGKPTFRHERFEEYKIQRKPMPDPLISQLPLVKSLLAACRIPVFEREGYEGEDVLATIAAQIAGQDLEVFLVTGDKDALQLVNTHIKVYNPHKDDQVLDADAVRARYGVGPERMVDLMALMGDDIDNIPGVPGIGEKTATQLLKQFGSLEALYARLDEIESPSRRESLAGARQQVALCQELARIDQHVPLTVTLDELRIQEPDWRALRALYRDLEFKKLLAAIDVKGADGSPAGPHPSGLSSSQEIEQCLTALDRQSRIALGVWETSGGLVIALSSSPEATWAGRIDPALWQTPAGIRLAAWFADGSATKLGHDMKAMQRRLNQFGLTLNGIAGDTMLAAYLINPARTDQALSDLSDEWLGEPLAPLPALETLTAEASEALTPFGRHVGVIARLHDRLLVSLEDADLAPLYHELELPLLDVLARMEADGIAVDLAYLSGLRASMDAQLNRLVEEVYRLAGTTFNLNSPKQLGHILFERLGLPVIKRTKTGPSTDSDVLQQLAARHPLPQQLLQYRELSKLVSTYVDALPKLADPSGRIHTSFNQTATATGRLSSSEPNLQNIPIKTELGRSIRKAFIPGIPDGVLVAADYSQIELRILAHCSGDERLSEAFREGRDIHRFTASLIYGCPESAVQPEQRNAMKAVNFGILYGMSSHGLSKELGLSFEEAQAFIDAYFERYPRVRAYLDAQIEQARREGYVQTLLGRRRYIPEVRSHDGMIRQVGERMAINAPIQGSAADLIKRAMVQLSAALARQRLASRMVLQVHDELVFEAPRRELQPLGALVRDIMEHAITLTVPLVVTVKAGPNWLEMTDMRQET